MNSHKVLLLNLGTPEQAAADAVRPYLKEFLNDERVIDLPAVARYLLVNAIIVPFRYKKTTAAYQQIWTEAGSPLLSISQQMKEALAVELGEHYQVELGMRYGQPSIMDALKQLGQGDKLTIIPLYPQYSSAASGSALAKTFQLLAQQWNIASVRSISDFYQNPGFISAVTKRIQMTLGEKKFDQLIFSYHGLPERHLNKSNCVTQCDHINACPAIDMTNRYCYRAQCFTTSQLIANQLGLSASQYVVSFQSRLGRTPWIKPYTDLLLPTLIQQGVRDIAVVSPSFIADCLETLEEINIRTRLQWQTLGGNDFIFVPCVNADSDWITALANMVR